MQLYNKAKKLQLYEIYQNSHTLGMKNTRFNKTEVTCFNCMHRRSGDKRTPAAFIIFRNVKVYNVCLVFKKSALSSGVSLLSGSC